MKTLDDFNQFLNSKLEPDDTAPPARVVSLEIAPQGYVEYYGKPAALAIELESKLPRRVDDFAGFSDSENGIAVAKTSMSTGGGLTTAKYVVWR